MTHLRSILTGCLTSLALAGCSLLPKSPEQENKSLRPELVDKVARYKAIQRLDEYGFTSPKCDSTLFTALCKTAGGCEGTDLFLAEDTSAPGRWYRHALHDCYPSQSGSDISRDMLLGVLIYLAKTRNLDALLAIQAYGRENDWIMGRGEVSRTYFTPLMQSNLGRAIVHSGGFTVVPEPVTDLPVNTGYQAHLDVLGIFLRGMTGGEITTPELYYLGEQVKREPENALFQAVYHRFSDGKQTAAEDILMGEARFPADAMPTSTNYCTEYLWQRDSKRDGQPSHDWRPCPDEAKTHDGVDFLFAAFVAGY